MRCSSLAVPRVASVSACVWPRVKSAEPCVRGANETPHEIGRISVAARPSGRRLSTAIFSRTICLVDGVGRPPRPLPGERVEPQLAARRGTAAAARPRCARTGPRCLADLSSLESCSASVKLRSASPNCSRTGPLTAAMRRSSASMRDCRARPACGAPSPLRRRPADTAGSSAARISASAAAMPARPCSASRAIEAAAVARRDLGRDVGVDPLGLARRGRAARAARHRASGSPRARASKRLEHDLLARPSAAPASTIVMASAVPQTIRSSVESSMSGIDGLTTSSPSMRPMRTAPIGPRKGSGEIIERRRGAVDREDVVRVHAVDRQRGADDLHLVPVALRPQRPDRAVDHARVRAWPSRRPAPRA